MHGCLCILFVFTFVRFGAMNFEAAPKFLEKKKLSTTGLEYKLKDIKGGGRKVFFFP
jgi:hypothetical protein